MGFLVLGNSVSPDATSYRGCYREHIYYQDDLPAEHEINKLFLWYCDNAEDDLIANLETAAFIVNAWQNLATPQYFEIVEVTNNGENPKIGSELLGYDIVVANWYSLLYFGLEFRKNKKIRSDNPITEAVDKLTLLLQDFFQPKLNKNVLFEDFSIATQCLDCMMSLQNIEPGLWENETVIFEVVGLWLVTEQVSHKNPLK